MAMFFGEDDYLDNGKQKRRRKVFDIFYLYLVFAVVTIVLIWTTLKHPITQAIFSFAILLFIFVFDKVFYKSRYSFFKFRSGLNGEDVVKEELRKLDDSYYVFQNIQLKDIKSNIDFVVAGSTGVFAVEVKNEKVNITNHEQINKSQLLQALLEATRLHDYLKSATNYVFVHSILVYSRDSSSVTLGNGEIDSVNVIQKRWLIKTITEREKIEINPEIINSLKNLSV